MKRNDRLVMFLLASALAVGCGKGNNDNVEPNNTTANNTTANNTTANNTTANNTTANNTTANNTTANNTTANNTTGTNTYTPHDFTCPNEVTPAGTVADIVGTHDVIDGCFGENNFGLLQQLCPDGVLTSVVYSNYQGRFIIGDDNTFVKAVSSEFVAEIYVPEACATALGGGTCDGVAMFIDNATGVTTSSCADEPPNPGDCLCDVNGPGGERTVGTIEDGANAGEYVLSYLDPQDDDSFVAVTETWEFQYDGAALLTRNTDTTTSYSAMTNATDASECEQYCLGFMALCNEHPDVTSAYADTLDCVTQCMGFTPGVAGDMAGDTRACRIYHLGAAADPSDVGNPDTHCPHAQATATAPCN